MFRDLQTKVFYFYNRCLGSDLAKDLELFFKPLYDIVDKPLMEDYDYSKVADKGNVRKAVSKYSYIVFKGLLAMCALVTLTMWSSVTAYAGINKSTIKSVGNGDTSNGSTFGGVRKKVSTMGKSGIGLVRTLLVVCALVSVIFCGVSFVVTKNAHKHEENKNWMFRIAIGCAIGFGAASIVTTFANIGEGL